MLVNIAGINQAPVPLISEMVDDADWVRPGFKDMTAGVGLSARNTAAFGVTVIPGIAASTQANGPGWLLRRRE